MERAGAAAKGIEAIPRWAEGLYYNSGESSMRCSFTIVIDGAPLLRR